MYAYRVRYRRRPARRLPPTKTPAAPATKAPPPYRKIRWVWPEPVQWRPQRRVVLTKRPSFFAPPVWQRKVRQWSKPKTHWRKQRRVVLMSLPNGRPITLRTRSFALTLKARSFSLTLKTRSFSNTLQDL